MHTSCWLNFNTHFNIQAFVTVVVSLNAFGTDYTGGLFVRGGFNTTDQYIDLGAGSAAVHQVRSEGDGNRRCTRDTHSHSYRVTHFSPL